MYLPRFWYLRDLAIEERLPEDVLGHLRERARLERWGHRAHIFRTPDDVDVSVILDGSVWLQEGPRLEEVTLGPGDVFGKAAERSDHGELKLQAHDDTLLARMPRDEFRDIVAPHLGRLETSVGLFHRRRDLWVPVRPLLFTTPKSRLAKVLLHLVETEGRLDDETARLDLTLQPRKLSDLTGVSRERVREVLSALEEERILEANRGDMRIWDMARLRRMARGE